MTCYQIWYNAADGEKKNDFINSNDNDFQGVWTGNAIISSNNSDFRGSVKSSAFILQERPLELQQHKDSWNREQPSTDGIYR